MGGGAFALMHLGLCARVINERQETKTLWGDGSTGKPSRLTIRTRCQQNFAEHVPLGILLLGLVETSGGRGSACPVAPNNLLLFGIAVPPRAMICRSRHS